jgi:hypothetical protein
MTACALSPFVPVVRLVHAAVGADSEPSTGRVKAYTVPPDAVVDRIGKPVSRVHPDGVAQEAEFERETVTSRSVSPVERVGSPGARFVEAATLFAVAETVPAARNAGVRAIGSPYLG